MGQRIVPYVTTGKSCVLVPWIYTVSGSPKRTSRHSALLAPHAHDRTVVAVMVEGSFDLVIRGTHPRVPPGHRSGRAGGGERHANKVGHLGARTIVIEPTPLYELQHLDAYRDLLVSPSAFVHPPSSAIAARLRTALHARDALGEFALEELALRLARRRGRSREDRVKPTDADVASVRAHADGRCMNVFRGAAPRATTSPPRWVCTRCT